MAQTKFFHTSGNTSFFADADAALLEWLAVAGHSDTTLTVPAQFLEDSGVTLRRGPQLDPRISESKSNFPVVYAHTKAFNLADFESVSLHVNCTTELHVWAQHSSAETAGAQAMEIAGALAVIIRQSDRDSAASFDWRDFYVNYAGGPSFMDVRTRDRLTWFPEQLLARVILEFDWNHTETIT